MPAEKTDFTAGAALALFPMLYGGALIAYLLASRPAPRHDTFGQPIPDLSGEGIGYAVVFTLLAFLTHLIVFTALTVRLIRSWRLRALLPLQLLCVAGSLLLLRSQIDSTALMLVVVLIGPAVWTLAIYLCGWLIARADRHSPIGRSS